MLISEHAVFSKVVLRVSTYIVLSLFPFFLAPPCSVFVKFIISWLKKNNNTTTTSTRLYWLCLMYKH